jgi:diphthine-ammonia ligase
MPEITNITIHLKIDKNPKTSQPWKALHVQSRSYWAPANIGPYSQAVSIPLSSPLDEESRIWTVSVAGQIALLPPTMTLPSVTHFNESASASPVDADFKFQTVLALQHLWRIGIEMNISWWTSAIAYLPRSTPSSAQAKARLAGRVWTTAHLPESADTDSDDEQRDLWEEKHYAGRENRGGKTAGHQLPDWEILEEHGERLSICPPMFTVEVEELPRGAAVEWHALLGVVEGRVKVRLLLLINIKIRSLMI